MPMPSQGPASQWPRQPEPTEPAKPDLTQRWKATARPSNWQKLSKNLHPRQFGQSAVGQALVNASTASQVSRSFRHAGFGAALRYAVGAEPISPKLRGFVHTQALQNMVSGGGNTPGSADPPHFLPMDTPPGEAG